MKRIFKYTFLQRIPAIVLHCAIMACMSGVEMIFLTLTKDVTHVFYLMWFVLTVLALAVIPLSVFIKCSSGYAHTLLFTNESYLMLTLPVRTEWILLGRILCGLLEFIMCAAVSVLFLSIVAIFWNSYYMGFDVHDFFRLITDLPSILARNIPGLFALLFIFIAAFILIGNVALVVQTVLRSFNIKRMRALWTVGGILAFMSILYFIGKIETQIGMALGDYCTITVHRIAYHDSTYHDSMRSVTYPSTSVSIPVVSIVLSIGLGIGFFFISTWLLKKKVEV